MKTNTPDQPKTNPPDSDQSARKSNASMSDEMVADAVVESTDLQTSHKTGKHSTVEKLAASRPNTGPGRGAQPVAGAFGDDPDHEVVGRRASPGTNQFECNTCGRAFTTEQDLQDHAFECRAAAAATQAGRERIKALDEDPHREGEPQRGGENAKSHSA